MQSDNTCYPPFSFLPLEWDHRPRRNFFMDCGTLGSVYIFEDGKTLTQNLHEGSKVPHLSAQYPSLPLFEKPKYGISDIEVVGQEDFKQRNKKLQYLCKRMKELKTIFKRKKLDSSAMMSLLKTIHDYENTGYKMSRCQKYKVFKRFNKIPHLRNLYERYSSLFDITDVRKTNSNFTGGGCLQIINFPDDPPPTAENGSVCMAAVSGINLDKIKIFRADLKESGLLSVDESQMIKIESPHPLFELSNQCLYDQSLCAARSKNSCLMYKISTDNSTFKSCCVDEINFENEALISVFMSPYIPAECLVATANDTVYLWNADKGHDPVYTPTRKFDHPTSWKDVHYGSHPRSIVLTNSTSMDLIDIRTNGKKVTNLFSLPNNDLREKERLQISKYSSSNSFHHFLASDFALFMLDERFPGYPVLRWQHMLEGLPQYMCLVPGVVQSPQDDVLMIGSLHSELMSIQYRTNEQEPPVSVCSPWRISKIIDFSYIYNMHYNVEDSLIRKRLTASNIGITGLSTHPGMIAFQMNCLGDIFFQKYNVSTKFDDKTCSAGPGDHVVKLSMEAKCRFHYWMDHLRENVQEEYFCDAEHQNIAAIIKSLSHPPSSHVLCRLCMPQCDNEDIQSEDEDVIDGSCSTCNSPLSKSKWIVDAINDEKVIKSGISIDKKIPSIDNILDSSNHLTKTLYKLWNDEELSEEDTEEEEEKEEKGEEEGNKEKEKKKEETENGEEEKEKEEEEEVEEEETVNTQTILNKPSFSFVHWNEDSDDDEPETPKATKYNIPSTLPEYSQATPRSPSLFGPTDSDEPNSPLMFGPTQSQTPVAVVPDSLSFLQESPQKQSPAVVSSLSTLPFLPESQLRQQSPTVSALSTRPLKILQTSQISFVNKSELQSQLKKESQSQFQSPPFDKDSSDSDSVDLSPKTPIHQRQSQSNVSCFLSPDVLSKKPTDSPLKTSMVKDFVYEEGFGSVSKTQKNDNSYLLSTFLERSDKQKSLKKPPLKRNYEEGF